MGRPLEVLAEQKLMIRAALRSVVDRSEDCVSYGDVDRALVLPGKPETLGVQRSPRLEAEYAAAVRHLVDRDHPHLRWHLRAAVDALPLRDRQILRLRVGWDHSCGVVREALNLPVRFAVDAHVEYLLATLARALWADSGDAVVPPAAGSPAPPSVAAG